MPLATNRGVLGTRQLPDSILSALATGTKTIRELFEAGELEGSPADYDLTKFDIHQLGGLRINGHSPLASLADKTRQPVAEHIHRAVVSGRVTIAAVLGVTAANYDLSPYTEKQIGEVPSVKKLR